MSSICITSHKGIEISIDTETGKLSALIEGVMVQKDTLAGIKSTIDSSPVSAVWISADKSIADIVIIRTDRMYKDKWPIDAAKEISYQPEELHLLDEHSRAAMIMVKERKELSERLHAEMANLTQLTIRITEAE